MNPAVVVFASLYPSTEQPTAGIFIHERMKRVAGQLPVIVVSPQPWFPGQGVLRWLRPGYRPGGASHEWRDGVEIHRPRFLALPLLGRSLDSISMAVCSMPLLSRLRRAGKLDLIDAHFGYPDGHAACVIARWLRVPFTVTLRGTEPRIGAAAVRGRLQRRALRAAARVIGVAGSLADWARGQGVADERLTVVGNGVDPDLFAPIPRGEARRTLGLPDDADVLITVGGLTERKGFHRVIDVLPDLVAEHPKLHYLVVGGRSGEGDWRGRLEAQVRSLGLDQRVYFLGVVPPDALHVPLSAADVFVLASRNEGWANVLLEAMACGVPVVATDVGGNAGVVVREELGTVIPFGDREALVCELHAALGRRWDRDAIRSHARENAWDGRVDALVALLSGAVGAASAGCQQTRVEGASRP